MSRRSLLAQVRRERFLDGQASTPGGIPLEGRSLAEDLAFARGWNAATRSIEAWLLQGDVDAGLDELVANAPIEYVPAFAADGEGG